MTASAADGPLSVEEAVRLGEQLVGAWGSWSPTMTRDATRVAYISDRTGKPELWVQDLGPRPMPATRVPLTEDPILAVEWSADGAWLSCEVATDGGVRTQVWVVRPDGTDARRIAGSRDVHAELGPWTRSGHRVVVTIPSTEGRLPTHSYLADPATGELSPLAAGGLIHVLDISIEERLVVLRDGPRGHQFCVVVDRLADEDHPLLPRDHTGSTEVAFVRRAPQGDPHPAVAYLVTDAGRPRRELIAAPLAPAGLHEPPRTLAARENAELEDLDSDDEGRLLLMLWNVAGRSELELLETATLRRIPVPDLPGSVAYHPIMSRDGSSVIVSVDGPERPRVLWRLDVEALTWTPVTETPPLPGRRLVSPTLETFSAADGLPLSGWLYRVPGRTEPGPAALWLHGGPESQELPDFSPQHQALAAAGIAVFAPNIRGSSGFGREFVHADDLEKRYDAFADVLASAGHLVATGVADETRIAVTGRSYGGYLTLASLAFSPGVFAAGVNVCGMSDLHTFYRDTEPWIASAAFPKYGHPERDRELLRAISPLHQARSIDAPLLVIHGELDTNVPIGEAHQIVAALQGQNREVDYVELAGEGHEYLRLESKRRFVATLVTFLARALAS
jgi:dipeptidyl aminopeptidase/acylaminoacyl peptidase